MASEKSSKYEKKVSNRLGFALITFIAMMIIATVLLNYVFHFKNDNLTLYYVISYTSLYGVGTLLYWLITKNMPHQNIAKEKWGFGRLICCFFIAYAGGTICNYIYIFIKMIFGGSTISTMTSEAITQMVNTNPLLSAIVLILVAPAAEEFVFRKVIIDRTKCYGEKNAIVFSALCFAFFHMNPSQLMFAFCIGLVLGYVYSRTGVIHYTMIMHSIINLIGFLASFVVSKCGNMVSAASASDINSIVNGSTSDQLNYITTYGPWILLEYIIISMIFGFIITGIILFCKRIKKVHFEKNAPDQLKNIFPLITSVGMILFFIVSIAVMVFRVIVS